MPPLLTDEDRVGPAAWPRSVALLLATSRVGGSERSAIDLAVSLRESGVAVRVVCRDSGTGPLGAMASGCDVELERWRLTQRAVRDLSRSDVVVAFGFRWSLYLRVLRMLRLLRPGVLFVSAQRGLDVWRTSLLNVTDRWSARYVDLFLANSQAAADLLVEEVRIPPGKVLVTASGLDGSWFASRTTSRGAGPVRLMVVGTARVEKRHDVVVDVLRRLPREDWAATVYTSRAGDLRAQLRAAGLADAVATVQGHSLVPSDYDRHDVLLHASDAESLPRVVVEALARGLSVVATDVGDTARVLAGRGWVVPAGNVDQLVSACLEAMEGVPGADAAPPASALDPKGWSRAAASRDFLLHVRTRRPGRAPDVSQVHVSEAHLGHLERGENASDEQGRAAARVRDRRAPVTSPGRHGSRWRGR